MAKVKFGFKNCYYATVTETEGVYTYGTPVKLAGAVSMSLDPSGDTTEFYADDSKYFSDENNNGYEGSLELAMIPDSFKKDILGETEDANGVMFEKSTVVNKPFALLCEFTTDTKARKYVFYNCMAKRPTVGATTKGENVDVQTESLDLVIRPNLDGVVKASTNDSTDATTLNGWYTQVYTETELSA